MFSGQREFHGLVITSTSLAISDLRAMFPSNQVQDASDSTTEPVPGFVIFHGYYLSPIAYTSPDALNDAKIIVGRRELYKYDFYICQWKRGRRASLLCLVPFGRMAKDVFSLFDRGARRFKRQYSRLKLQAAIDHLADDHKPLDEMVATRVHFQVSGSDSAKSAVIAGSDVVSSELYRRTVRNVRGIQLVPRRLRLRYVGNTATTVVEADVHGNLLVRLRKNGANLKELREMLTVLDDAGLIEETIAYPLRRGVVGEDDNE